MVKKKAVAPPAAYALYVATGPNAVKVNAFVRPSTRKEGWYLFENSLGENEHGTKSKIAKLYVNFDMTLTQKGYKRTNSFNSDPIFKLP